MDEPEEIGTLAAWRLRLETLRELAQLTGRNNRLWMLPMLLVLGVLGLALSGLQAVQYVAPFLYAVF
ncbi:MAG: hypothetical protein H6732_15355 [Alphaproteobacteria bacterium]|nr:hypothetical protein [Alphaproteobacteria bacterium]